MIIERRCRALVLCVALPLLGLSSCAGGPQYRYNVDPAADFGSYRTFAFLDERERKMVPYQSVAHRHLKSAIRREMQARGFAPSDDPDLLVNIHLQRRDAGKQTQSAAAYYAYRSGLYGWREGVSTAAGTYTDGTLNIDVIDAAERRLLWEGIAVGSISQRMYENLEGTIDSVTAKVFERFPRHPPS